jgi:hypothetical protein
MKVGGDIIEETKKAFAADLLNSSVPTLTIV